MRLRADLILASFKCVIDLSPSDFFLRSPRGRQRGHAYGMLQGPSHLRRRNGAFSVHGVKYWNKSQEPLVMSPTCAQCLSLQNSWTVNGPKFFPMHLCNFCSPSPTSFLLRLFMFPLSTNQSFIGPHCQSNGELKKEISIATW